MVDHEAGQGDQPDTLPGTAPEGPVAVAGPESCTRRGWGSEPATRKAPASPSPEGRPGTFEEFFAAHYRTLLKLARCVGANHDEADEAAAKTMLEVFAAWRRLDDPLAWAKKAVIRFFFKERTRGLDRIRERLVSRHGQPPTQVPVTDLTDWEQWRWTKQLLLDLLTPEQRRVMELMLEGYTPTEIAETLGVSPGAVRQRLTVARRPLAAAWRQQMDEPQEPDGGQV